MKTKEQLKQILLEALKPVPKVSVSNWADNFQVLPSTSAEPGSYKTSRVPYMKDVMDAFTQPGIHRVVVKSSSQVGKSSVLLNVIGRFVHLDPCNILLVQPTLEMAQDFSKDRLAKMIVDCKALTPLFYGDGKTQKAADKNQTMLSKFFKGGRIVLAGANSAAGLASRPVRMLLCDEVDRFPPSAAGEGDPVDLAQKRMTTYWNHIMGLFSTPTVEGESRIDLEYQAGTQEEWQHECPNCHTYHKMDYKNFLSDIEEVKNKSGRKIVIVKSAAWQCPDCGFSFSEQQIKAAPQKYVAQNPDAIQNGIRSFWVNTFSSAWMSWNDILREWHEAKGNATREQVVVNTRFGESYHLTGEYEDESIFLSRLERYGAELPDSIKFLTAAVDVQGNRLEFEVCGWAANEARFGVWRGLVLGSPTNADTWAKLDEILTREYHFADGRRLKIARTFIDSGYSTANVYDFVKPRQYRGVFAIKGEGAPGLPLLHNVTKANNFRVTLWTLGVSDGKQEIFSRLAIDTPGARYLHFPQDDGCFGRRGYDEVYFKELISERRVVKMRGGIPYVGWETVKQGVRNESLDLAVYNLACAKSLGLGAIRKPRTELPKPVSVSMNLF